MKKETDQLKQKVIEEFVEKGAALEHDRWARWHRYSRLMATPKNMEMWDRKAEMPYIALTNEEQESDRKETRNYIPLPLSELDEQEKAVREKAVREKCLEIISHSIDKTDAYNEIYRKFKSLISKEP